MNIDCKVVEDLMPLYVDGLAFIIALFIGMFADVYIFSFFAYLFLGSSILVLIWNVDGSNKWYWMSGICMYLFSALAGFSIGLYTASLAFVLLTLALGHSFGWINKRFHSLIGIAIGFLIWGAAINIYDGYWLFYPAIVLFERLFG